MRHGITWLLVLAGTLAAQTTINGSRTITGAWDAGSSTATRPARTGSGAPAASCTTGAQYFRTDATAGQNLYLCTATNVWTQVTGSGGSGLPAMSGNANKVLSNNGTIADWRALGGDVSGAPETVSVDKLKGTSVSSTAPENSQALVYDGSAYVPRPLVYAFESTQHYLEYFPYCWSSGNPFTMLGWGTFGSAYFTFSCPSATSNTPLRGLQLNSTTSTVAHSYITQMATNYGSSTGTRKWTAEWEFSFDATSQTNTSSLLGLIDGSSAGNGLALRHDTAATDPSADVGFALCLGVSSTWTCFKDVVGWDTSRHVLRWERVSTSLLRARLDGGSWYNFHTDAGTNGTYDKYSLTFPSANLYPEVWYTPREASSKKFLFYRFELLYGY